jgi:hypothetical protein
MGTIVFPGSLIRASRIVTVEEKIAHLRGNMPGTGDDDATARNVDVTRIDDCHFQAVLSGTNEQLAVLNLGVLSEEYLQGWNGSVTISGTGKEPAVCFYFFQNRCFVDLNLGFAGVQPVTGEVARRALRAVQFLQKYCPPQRLRF